MAVIEVERLQKVFRTKSKDPGLRGSMQALLRPNYSEVAAVKGISFQVEEGELLAVFSHDNCPGSAQGV